MIREQLQMIEVAGSCVVHLAAHGLGEMHAQNKQTAAYPMCTTIEPQQVFIILLFAASCASHTICPCRALLNGKGLAPHFPLRESTDAAHA